LSKIVESIDRTSERRYTRLSKEEKEMTFVDLALLCACAGLTYILHEVFCAMGEMYREWLENLFN
jgi:hypothetical protein